MTKRQRSVTVVEDKTLERENKNDKHESKRRRKGDDRTSISPPLILPTSPPANLSERHSLTLQTQKGTEEKEKEEEEEKEEEKARFPPSPIVIPSLQLKEEEEEEEISKENRRNEDTNVDKIIVRSQDSDTDLVTTPCVNFETANVHCSQKSSQKKEIDHDTSLRAIQETPPPSARMLDRKNPPPPPKRPKRRHYGGIIYTRTYPRLALSPLVDDSPPASPRVFRSLENEFAFAMQDTPEIRPRIRPAPRMARGSRRSTRAGSSRAQRSLDTPTSTMVLRSRQLNPSLSVDGGKPENQREREQRDAQRRQ
ncbi:unnamed protein product [Peronospora farinosa]|uniref:Uncharacterized protein n=1 Tax=Peronospora farinosa TaxID=134698 RepID=A0AAV0TSY2_9STRA|nr:unnamed protein product [Peronospora farinosa]CAI5725709.1 unnamed protein product [Peronospora farinosa]